MGLEDLVNKGKQYVSDKDGKIDYQSAQKAYGEFNKTEGSVADKAKAAYSEFSKDHSSSGKDEKK